VIFYPPDSAAAAVPSGAAHSLDAHMPPFWRAQPFPDGPVAAELEPLADATTHLRALLAKFESLDFDQTRRDVTYLTCQ
jgi:hypothetical protein